MEAAAKLVHSIVGVLFGTECASHKDFLRPSPISEVGGELGLQDHLTSLLLLTMTGKKKKGCNVRRPAQWQARRGKFLFRTSPPEDPLPIVG